MLRIKVVGTELFDEATNSFSTIDDVELLLEHSLVALSKWESKYQKPFLGKTDKTTEEVHGYIEAMDLSGNFSPEILSRLTLENYEEINNYIQSPETATTFFDPPNKKPAGRPETITSELIYFWLVSFQIPFECETWHLNRLFALIRICTVKSGAQKPKSPQEQAMDYRQMNEERKARLGTSG